MTYSAQHRDPTMENFERKLHQVLPEHFNRFLDGEPINLYEHISDHMHLHLYVWAPTPQRDLWTLVTAGMSAHQMNVPDDLKEYARAELVMTLPAQWPSIETIHATSDRDTSTHLWPFAEIAELARIPYLNGTWLGRGHTVRGYSGTDDTYAGSEFSGMLVDGVSSMPPEAMSFMVGKTPVHCYGLYPLYPEELRSILNRQLSGHEWFHRCVEAGFHEGLFSGRPVLV